MGDCTEHTGFYGVPISKFQLKIVGYLNSKKSVNLNIIFKYISVLNLGLLQKV